MILSFNLFKLKIFFSDELGDYETWNLLQCFSKDDFPSPMAYISLSHDEVTNSLFYFQTNSGSTIHGTSMKVAVMKTFASHPHFHLQTRM